MHALRSWFYFWLTWICSPALRLSASFSRGANCVGISAARGWLWTAIGMRWQPGEYRRDTEDVCATASCGNRSVLCADSIFLPLWLSVTGRQGKVRQSTAQESPVGAGSERSSFTSEMACPSQELHAHLTRMVNHSPFGHAGSLVKTRWHSPSLSTEACLKAAHFLS